MASQKTKFTVGLFVACGFSIAIVVFIWLGMSRLFEKGNYYVTYFNESVQGLDKDSPVKYRGVAIGRVDQIGVAPDSKLIQVLLKIESGQKLDDDIIAQLKAVGITGSMFIELDRRKAAEKDRSPKLTFPAEYPIVPSKPSDISELIRGVDDVLDQIRSLDLAGISDKIKVTLETTNTILVDANVKEISDNLKTVLEKTSASLTQVERTLAHIEGIVSEKKNTIKTAIEDIQNTMENATVLLQKGTSLIGNTDESLLEMRRHLLVIAQNLERATDNLNNVLELVADQPSQLIFGRQPAPRKVNE